MELIIGMLLAGGCVAFGAWAVRRRRALARTASPPLLPEAVGRSLEDPCEGDVVGCDGVDWIVTGAALLTDGSVRWSECRLDDAGREAWLMVHPADPDAVLLGERVPDLGTGTRPSDSLDHKGKVLKLERFGRAKVIVEGNLDDVFRAGECGYWNYSCAGDVRVWFRESNSAWSYFAGRCVRRHLVTFLPGS